MTIALIAHDSKKELMVQFCTAYCRILSQHKLVATGTTGKLYSPRQRVCRSSAFWQVFRAVIS